MPEQVFPEKNTKSKHYLVSGERHGTSFFKKFEFPEVEYRPGTTLDFTKYHTVDVMYHWYETWAGGDPMFVNVRKVHEAYPSKNLLFTLAHTVCVP